MITGDSIQGHWVREWIKAPEFEDHTTRVNWIQVGMDYADVRIPLDRPDLQGVSRLDDLPPDVLLQLADAEGFAGHVTLDGALCTWHREINWHGIPENLDIGALSFDATGAMIEEGVQADYAELWHARTAGQGTAFRVAGAGYLGLLVTCGSAFVLGIGRPGTPPTRPLKESLRKGQLPEGMDRLFDGIHAYGVWTGTDAVARLATQPLSENRVVASLTESGVTWRRIGFDGMETDIELAFQTTAAALTG